MSKIYEQSLFYRIVKKYVGWSLKKFYSEYIVVGRENIPKDGSCIFAPNHRNALMDALAITTVTPNTFSSSFLARADIFRNKKIAKLLYYAKIMPAFRIRDGFENLGRNNEVFESCTELLEKGNALCIMPEGNQETEQKIRPLVKGIFRIAFTTQEKCGNETPIKIIPVGLDYGDIYKFGKHIIINIGKPIEMTDYMDLYRDNPALAMNELRQRLSDELSVLTVNIDTEENYESFLTATTLAGQALSPKNDKTIKAFMLRKKTADTLVLKEKENPASVKDFAKKCSQFEKTMALLKLKPQILTEKATSTLLLIIDSLLLIATLPLFLQGFIMNFIPFHLPVLLRKKVFKAKFDGFFSSLHYATGIFIFPIYYIILTILFIIFAPVSWWVVLIFTPLQLVLGKWALIWYKEFRKLIARVRYAKLTKNNNLTLLDAIRLKNEILDFVK